MMTARRTRSRALPLRVLAFLAIGALPFISLLVPVDATTTQQALAGRQQRDAGASGMRPAQPQHRASGHRHYRRPRRPVATHTAQALKRRPVATHTAQALKRRPTAAHAVQAHRRPVAAPDHHTVSYDRYSFKIDGHRVVLFGGEYQFWRTPAPQRWPVVLRELRAAGLNTVSVGVSWQYHSPAAGVYDFTGVRDLGRFLDEAAAAGLYVIARPGPVYDAESNASNLPGWLLNTVSGLRANTGTAYCGAGSYSHSYAAAYTDWYRHVLPIIATRQLTRGGSVVALQIENEYSPVCGSQRYMSDLHTLARRFGITVPLIANNNTCCSPAGAWMAKGRDHQPIVDIPAEDDYPCGAGCPPHWNGRLMTVIDGLERRLRGAGVRSAPLAVAELQGGFYTGWGGPSYSSMATTLGPALSEVLDGSVLAQGVTLVSIYMAAGGTSWGYLGGPNTATSYDYAAAIHEWGAPSAGYDSLKRTAMFVDAFGDALGATQRTTDIWSSNPSLLYATRQTVDGPQRGARLLVLRNTDPRHAASLWLHLPLGTRSTRVPQATFSLSIAPHALSLLLANYTLGGVRMRYSTSRPLTQATVNGDTIAVLYGAAGTPGETALAFATRPAILQSDRGIAATYDRATQTLRLSYRHDETPRTVMVATPSGHRLILVLTGPATAAHTWRVGTPRGTALVIGPRMIGALTFYDGVPTVQATVRDRTQTLIWAPHQTLIDRARGAVSIGAIQPSRMHDQPASPHGSRLSETSVALPYAVQHDIGGALPPLSLPTLTSWRFTTESPERLPIFNDQGWIAATKHATDNPNVPRTDTLLADDYGIHYGFVWYRGTFIAQGAERVLRMQARNSYSVWLNGHVLGSSTLHNDLKDLDDQVAINDAAPSNSRYADTLSFRLPAEFLRRGQVNTIAVLVESLGHNIGFANGERTRSPFGILAAWIDGPATRPAIAWRLQGGVAPQSASDTLASPLNASGLYGERHGWYRPDFDDRAWTTVGVPDTWTTRGLSFSGVAWYRTAFSLHLPSTIDAPLALDLPAAQDKVLIWLNGLLIGRYWNGVGPQHMFYLPAGLLNEHGRNTLALAVWNRGHSGGLTGGVFLRPYEENAQVVLPLIGS